MDLSEPLLNGAILALFTAIFTWVMKSRFDDFSRRFDAIEQRLDLLATEVAQLRSDLLQVALATRRDSA